MATMASRLLPGVPVGLHSDSSRHWLWGGMLKPELWGLLVLGAGAAVGLVAGGPAGIIVAAALCLIGASKLSALIVYNSLDFDIITAWTIPFLLHAGKINMQSDRRSNRPCSASSQRRNRSSESASAIGRGTLALLVVMTISFLFCPRTASGQVSASMFGVVTDQSGAVLSGTTVTARNLDTGFSRTTLTDESGRYQLFALPVGEYEVRAKKDGFAESVRTGVRLVVGQAADADLTLRVGSVTEEIGVTGDAALINVTTQDISGLVGERQVKDLPLNGRSYDLLLPLNPGIVNFTSEKTGGLGVSNSTTGNNFAVSGNRPQQNLFLLNGVEYTGAGENNMQPGGTSGELLGVDAVR